MATIQVRNVPDGVYRIYRRRAAGAGMSLQEYVLAELDGNARLRSPAELLAEVEDSMRAEGPAGFSTVSATDLVRADRDSR